MAKKAKSWKPKIKLEWFFRPTRDATAEIYKARTKNHNLPILQYMYNGDEQEPLHCLVSGQPGWRMINDFYTKKSKQRFNIDFNHIRQEQTGNRSPGTSKDRGTYAASEIFRGFKLDKHTHYLTEFMTMMPICQEYHNYISQDSAMNSLSLPVYDKKQWPWFLKKRKNFNRFSDQFDIEFDYGWFIDHLSDIGQPSIYNRIYWGKK